MAAAAKHSDPVGAANKISQAWMQNRSRKSNLFLAIWGIASVAILVYGLVANPYYIRIGISTLLAMILAVTWDMVSYPGQLSLGHAAFFGTGAYVGALSFTKLNWNLLASLIPAAIIGIVLALIIGRISIRLQGAYFAIATFAFAEAMRVLVLLAAGLTNGPLGVTVLDAPPFPVQTSPQLAIFVYFLLLLEAVVLVNVWLRKSRWNFAFRAIGESEAAAATSGVSIRNTRLISFCISAMFVSMAGAIYSHYITYIDPTSVYSVQTSVVAIIYAVFGGVNTLAGPLVGAALLSPIGEALRVALGPASLLVYGSALLLTIIFIPGGIMGLLDMVTARFSKRAGSKQRGE